MSHRHKRRRWLFAASLAALGVVNALLRMTDLPDIHPANQFFFYFWQPVVLGVIFAGLCWIVIPAPEGGRKRDVRLPLRGIAIATMVFIALWFLGGAQADPLRSRALRSEFQRLNPCPATGQPRGACPGYEVDHREALICGGKDELQNLQWLPVAEHREKTKVEVKLCRARAARQQQEPPCSFRQHRSRCRFSTWRHAQPSTGAFAA